jgi:hypothetical protein
MLWRPVELCDMLRIPHHLENRLTDGGEVVSRILFPRNIYFFLFLVLISERG